MAVIVTLAAWSMVVEAAPGALAPTEGPTRDRTLQGTRQVNRTATAAAQGAGVQEPATPEPATVEPATPEPASAEDEESADLVPTSPGPMTSQVVIFNPDTSGTATVQLDIYNSGGEVAYSTTLSVSANGAKVVNLPGSLGANFQGGAMISSDKNVQALVVGANANQSARDAYEGEKAPAQNVTLALVRHLAADTQNSILAVQNTTGTQAGVTVTFYRPDGTTARQEAATLAGHQSLYLNTNQLFPGTTFVGSVGIVADQAVSAAVETLYFKDTAAFRGVPAGEGDTTVYLDGVSRTINGAGAAVNWSEVYVRNNGAGATDVTLELHAPSGAVVAASTAAGVPANGQAQFLLSDGAFASAGNSFAGWARITSSGQPLTVASLDVLNKGKRLFGTNGLAGTQLGTRYVCGDTARSATQNSRITVLNADTTRGAKVIVRLFNKDTGAKVAQFRTNVAANGSATVALSDAGFASAGSSFTGMAVVVAKGQTPPKLVVSVNNPYGANKLSGTTGYACGKLK